MISITESLICTTQESQMVLKYNSLVHFWWKEHPRILGLLRHCTSCSFGKSYHHTSNTSHTSHTSHTSRMMSGDKTTSISMKKGFGSLQMAVRFLSEFLIFGWRTRMINPILAGALMWGMFGVSQECLSSPQANRVFLRSPRFLLGVTDYIRLRDRTLIREAEIENG